MPPFFREPQKNDQPNDSRVAFSSPSQTGGNARAADVGHVLVSRGFCENIGKLRLAAVQWRKDCKQESW